MDQKRSLQADVESQPSRPPSSSGAGPAWSLFPPPREAAGHHLSILGNPYAPWTRGTSVVQKRTSHLPCTVRENWSNANPED